MVMVATMGGTERKFLSHYAAVKARLRNPKNLPPRNKLKDILAQAERRAAEHLAEAERLRAEREAEEARVKKSELQDYYAYRAEKARRFRKRRENKLARFAADMDDFEHFLKHCPFKASDSPSLRKATRVILKHYRVTWLELVSNRRPTHVVAARATFYHVLREVGFSWYGIAKVMGLEPNTTSSLILLHRKWAEKARDNSCFLNTMDCVKNICVEELDVWKVKPKTENLEN